MGHLAPICSSKVHYMALREVRQGGWLCKQSVMALGEICYLRRLAHAFTCNIQPQRTSLRAMTE